MNKDLYAVLGVERTQTPEIRTPNRNLRMSAKLMRF